jgi:hydrogenase maturation factor
MSAHCSAAADTDARTRHCVTCGDDADPMTVVSVDKVRGLALCQCDDGTSFTVETALVEPVMVQDRLLVHAGTAIVRIASLTASA